MDRIDKLLVKALQEDGKASLNSLGEVVGLSAPSVMERVRKLEAAGVIRGYAAIVDARAVDLDVTSFIGVSLESTQHIDSFEQAMQPVTEVLECHHVTGAHTMMLKVKTRNTAGLEKLIRVLRDMDGVSGTQTLVVLSTCKETLALPIEVEAASPKHQRPSSKSTSKNRAKRAQA